MLKYEYEEFVQDIKTIVNNLQERPDAIIAIARGGLTPAHFISLALDIREVYTINALSYEDKKQSENIKISNIPEIKNARNVLIVDEIIDSGRTMSKIYTILSDKYREINFKVATIFYKKSAEFTPDYYVKEAKEWVDFFWERDTKK